MSLDMQKLSPHLKEVLLNLKHLSPTQRFNELSRPRFELQWKTMAFLYGIEKLEAQGWMIADQEILNPKSKILPLINADDTDLQKTNPPRRRGDAEEIGSENQKPQKQTLPLMNADDADLQQQVEEQVNSGLERMAEAAAMETERTPMPENTHDEDAVRKRDNEIWRRACEYIEATLRPRIEAEIRRQVGAPMQWDPPEDRAEYHRRQLAKLTKADAAPRCEHIYTDGTTCGAPKLKNGHWCYAHARMKAVRVTRLRLLPMEDGNSIMLNLMEIQRALVEGEITERTAGLLMYNQQLGLIALKGITFRETDAGAMVTELPKMPGLPRSPKLKSGSPQRTQRAQRNRVIGTSGDRVIGKTKTHHGDTETRTKKHAPQRTQRAQRETLPLMKADHADLQQTPSSPPEARRRRGSRRQPTADGKSHSRGRIHPSTRNTGACWGPQGLCHAIR